MSTLSLAFNRFGLGARNDEPAPDDARRWLLAQLDRYEARPQPIAAAPQRGEIAGQLADYFEEVRFENRANRRAGLGLDLVDGFKLSGHGAASDYLRAASLRPVAANCFAMPP